eukprot:scaffold95070_cov24-Tisochrysis_lutea.AAC.2
MSNAARALRCNAAQAIALKSDAAESTHSGSLRVMLLGLKSVGCCWADGPQLHPTLSKSMSMSGLVHRGIIVKVRPCMLEHVRAGHRAAVAKASTAVLRTQALHVVCSSQSGAYTGHRPQHTGVDGTLCQVPQVRVRLCIVIVLLKPS